MITQRLLAAGKEVRILVRHDSPSEELAKQGLATSAQTLINAGAQPVYGDLKDRPSLDAACQGIETLITTANSALRGGWACSARRCWALWATIKEGYLS
jgi:uncharacterized protein YbjT (DUF2867 family)